MSQQGASRNWANVIAQNSTNRPEQVSTATQESQNNQSRCTAEDLTKRLEGWADLSVAVILVGKLDSLLIQSIVCDIYHSCKKKASLVVSKMEVLQTEVFEDRLQKVENENFRGRVKQENKNLECKTSKLAKVFEKVFKNHNPKAFENKLYTQDEIESFEWFENEVVPARLSNRRFQTSTQDELNEIVLALMHEWIFIIYDRHFDDLITKVPTEFLSTHEKFGEIKDFRDKRNEIVHRRTSHCFDDEDERCDFLDAYAEISEKFIKTKDCFCLEDKDKKEEKLKQYMQPEKDFETLLEILQTYTKLIAEKERELRSNAVEREKLQKEIEDLQEQLDNERFSYRKLDRQYRDLQEDVMEAQVKIAERTKIARGHIKTLKEQTLEEEMRTKTLEQLEQTQDDIDWEMRNIRVVAKESQQTAEDGEKEADEARTGADSAEGDNAEHR